MDLTKMKQNRINSVGLFLLISILMLSCKSLGPSNVEVSSYRLQANDQIENDHEMEAMISVYRKQLVEETSEIIGTIETQLTKQKPESTLGNFFTDLLYDEGAKLWNDHTDFAVQNYGGLRRPSLPKGDLNVGHIYELMPFENYITRIKGDSILIQALFDRIASVGGWPVSRQVRFVVQNGKAINITIDGQALNSSRKYSFLLPDYVANGGDRFAFLKTSEKEVTDVLIRDALIDNLKTSYLNNEIISSKIEGRIILEK